MLPPNAHSRKFTAKAPEKMLLLQILRFASQLLVKKLPPGKHIKRVSFCRQRKGILYEFMFSAIVKARHFQKYLPNEDHSLRGS